MAPSNERMPICLRVMATENGKQAREKMHIIQEFLITNRLSRASEDSFIQNNEQIYNNKGQLRSPSTNMIDLLSY